MFIWSDAHNQIVTLNTARHVTINGKTDTAKHFLISKAWRPVHKFANSRNECFVDGHCLNHRRYDGDHCVRDGSDDSEPCNGIGIATKRGTLI